MGVDIDMFAERRRSAQGWERAEPMVPNPFREDEVWMKVVRRNPGWEERYPALVREPIYNSRNRHLYHALVLGVSAGRQPLVEPVAPPRGIPDDVTTESRAWNHPDAYCRSWLLVREIEEYDWDQEVIETTSRCMAVEPWGEPRGWRTVGVLPEGEGWEPVGELMTAKSGAIIQAFARPSGTTYREVCKHFLEVSLPRLQSYGPSDEVRLVFWLG